MLSASAAGNPRSTPGWLEPDPSTIPFDPGAVEVRVFKNDERGFAAQLDGKFPPVRRRRGPFGWRAPFRRP